MPWKIQSRLSYSFVLILLKYSSFWFSSVSVLNNIFRPCKEVCGDQCPWGKENKTGVKGRKCFFPTGLCDIN